LHPVSFYSISIDALIINAAASIRLLEQNAHHVRAAVVREPGDAYVDALDHHEATTDD
jgi:hypothetical protein